MTDIHIRPARPDDLDALYAISLATGDAGGDAAHLYRDGRLIGHIYSAPYLALHPEWVFVVEDQHGVGGYVLGVFDTAAFEQELERSWWPALRHAHVCPAGDPDSWNADERRAYQIHHPSRAPHTLVEAYPAHLHMNLLPRLQGRGMGTTLLDLWLDLARQGSISSVHLGANRLNAGAMRFWTARGFTPLAPPLVAESSRTCWFGRQI